MTCRHMRPGPTCALGMAEPAALPVACDGCRFASGRTVKPLQAVGPPRVGVAAVGGYLHALSVTKALGRVSLPVIEARTAACESCEGKGQHAPDPDPLGYCLWCDCGWRKGARLSEKVTMRAVRRPPRCGWPVGDEPDGTTQKSYDFVAIAEMRDAAERLPPLSNWFSTI